MVAVCGSRHFSRSDFISDFIFSDKKSRQDKSGRRIEKRMRAHRWRTFAIRASNGEVDGVNLHYEEIENMGKPTSPFLHVGFGNIEDLCR